MFSMEEKVVDEWQEKATELDKKAKEIITSALKSNNYDGIILLNDKGSFGRSTDAYIALNPSQVKSADIITYDENGKIIPLSERFNDKNDDIRYSVRKKAQTDPAMDAKKILRQAGSSSDVAEVTERIERTREFAKNNEWVDAINEAREMAQDIYDNSKFPYMLSEIIARSINNIFENNNY